MSDGAYLELTAVFSEHARFHHVPAYVEVVRRAHKFGLAGASVFRGIEGFGHAHRVHESHALQLNAHTSVLVVIVDRAMRIREFLPQLQEICGDQAVITTRAVEVLATTIGRR